MKKRSKEAIKAAKAGRLGARRVVQIRRLIALDTKINRLRTLQQSVNLKIADIDRKINSLGFGG